jgi:putative hydrolases of HD superfamily
LILDFFNTAANLKKISRQGWIDKLTIDNPESVADHTFSMAIIGMIFSDLENCNTEKILKMILLHDLAESIIGDLTTKQIAKEQKTIVENSTMKKILNNLPISLKKQYLILWNEYQANNSKEANIIHQLDKIEMALQAKIYSTEGHKKEKLESFFISAKNEIYDPKLLEWLAKILNQL